MDQGALGWGNEAPKLPLLLGVELLEKHGGLAGVLAPLGAPRLWKRWKVVELQASLQLHLEKVRLLMGIWCVSGVALVTGSLPTRTWLMLVKQATIHQKGLLVPK